MTKLQANLFQLPTIYGWTLVTSNNGQSNKLGFYSRLKTTFEMEPYLKNVNNFYLRKQICKFRCSDHKLEIETGRHRKIDINSRICRICNSSIESEMHFLAICPLYESLRNRYFERKHENDLINLLKCKNKTDAFNIGNFIIKATKLRENTLRAPENPVEANQSVINQTYICIHLYIYSSFSIPI